MRKKIQEICCPNCGARHFVQLYMTTTCLCSVAEEWIDGKLIRHPNPNSVTYHFRCAECGTEFTEDNVIFIDYETEEVPSAR